MRQAKEKKRAPKKKREKQKRGARGELTGRAQRVNREKGVSTYTHQNAKMEKQSNPHAQCVSKKREERGFLQ